jgi:hypothetical protein
LKRGLIAGACTLFLVLFFVAGSVAAQGTLGRLVGTVLDSSGAVLPGATTTLTNAATGFKQTEVANGQGGFSFSQIPVGTYTLVVELPAFKTVTYTDVVINVGQEYSLTARLEVGAVAENVTVTAGISLVTTTTPEVSTTVQQRQVLDIPLTGRDVTNLIKLQPGVAGIQNRAQTVINGGRPTWTQVTLDGINIQDNFIRTNSLDFLPNRPTEDNVAEFSITTSVAGADTAGGATSVRMVTPSGSNAFHGSVFEFNRTSKFSANSFFNNASGVEKPKLSRNQTGGRLGGPVLKNKLFFFGYYEAYRQSQQASQNLDIPTSTAFLDGLFRYVALDDGSVRSVNVMQLSGLPIDQKLRADFLSKLPGPQNINNYDIGNSSADRVLNTAGYRFNQTVLTNRDQYAFRGDYDLNANHKVEAIYSHIKETGDRDDLDSISTNRPLVFTNATTNRQVGAWRWLASPRFQNEVRGGFNLSRVAFDSNWDYRSGVLYNTVLGIANPIGGNNSTTTGGSTAGFQPQGRYTNTYQGNDNALLLLGSHDLQFGGSWQRIHVNPYNYAGRFPVATFGLGGAPAGVGLTSARFPGGIAPADLTNANAMAAWLGGVVNSVAQTFQVKDTTSGFVKGIPSNENYTFDNVTAYLQDNWRWKPNFTVRAGLKWEYYSPLSEDNNLGFLPILNGRSIDQVMLDPATQVTFVHGQFYKKNLGNFGPTVGFAWNVTNDGKTAVRAGYSLTYVSEESITVGRAAARGNSGLSSNVALTNQYQTVSAGIPLPATPAFLTTRTLADQIALSPNAVLWGIDPNLKSPKVHQVSVGMQRELRGSMAAEARYVGTFGRDIWRGIDYNQVKISAEFLADFNRARTNGYLAAQAGLDYSPAFNANVPGSQPLTVLPSFGTPLTNTTLIANLQTNQVAALADFYISTRAPGALATFMQNPGIYGAQAIVNGGFSDYNALQFELRRQNRNGIFAQVNYTYAHSKTDSAGTAQNRFEAFLDNQRPGLSTGRSFFHQTHVVNANAIYELPFGQGKRWANSGGLVDQVAGGWQLGTVLVWQSGAPISFYSGRGTFNRGGRSDCLLNATTTTGGGVTGCNTAFSTMSVKQIKSLLGIYKQSNGKIYWIDPKVIDPGTGKAVGADNLTNAPGFAGQIFFNPVAGEVGNLPILAFDGPAQARIDLALSKRIRVTDRQRLEVKGEAFNLLNKPSFFRGDIDINSTTFGRLTSVDVGSRIIQLSVRYEF